ncbi:hypothetical protein DdX_17298 [Ditylenchus destructor]|uniref:Uncharacterized protein n=1 Tax=Ditylenchus destructor TaxID=166010 RepID=A0AAD4QTI1_9BILA|nr:hypothetical protein DdX_17298 [Ditylenchus destructor]
MPLKIFDPSQCLEASNPAEIEDNSSKIVLRSLCLAKSFDSRPYKDIVDAQDAREDVTFYGSALWDVRLDSGESDRVDTSFGDKCRQISYKFLKWKDNVTHNVDKGRDRYRVRQVRTHYDLWFHATRII